MLQATHYILDNFNVERPLSENTGKRRGFAYVKLSRYASDELSKYIELNLKGRC